jgi:MFS transporter, DHA2 family, multidrug resistance protein
MSESSTISGGPLSTGAPAPRPVFAVGAVLLGAFLSSFDSRLLTVALPDLKGIQSLGFDEASWMMTATSAAQLLIAPAVAWLATLFGLRRILIVPSLLYAVLSVLVPFVNEYSTLAFLSVTRGLLLGVFVPATIMIIFRNLPMKWWLVAIAIYAARVGFSINLGVWVVGLCVDKLGWQWLFWQDALVAPLMALFAYLGTPREPINRALVRDGDWGGMLLLGTGMAMIYAGLDQGNRLDWFNSGIVTALILAGIVLVAFFFLNEAVIENPWAEAKVILSRNIGLAMICVLLYSLTSLSNGLLTPNFLVAVAGLRPEQIGWLFLMYGALPMLVFTPVAVWMARRVDSRIVVVVGFSAFFLAAVLGTRLTHQWAAENFVAIALFQSVGQSVTLIGIIVTSLSNVDPKRATAFAAYIQSVRIAAAEIGSALMGTWLRVREQTHSNLLGLNLTQGDPYVVDALTRLQKSFSVHDAGSAAARSVVTLSQMVQRQANTLAYIDGFWLSAWCAIIALFVVACMRRAPPGPFVPR